MISLSEDRGCNPPARSARQVVDACGPARSAGVVPVSETSVRWFPPPQFVSHHHPRPRSGRNRHMTTIVPQRIPGPLSLGLLSSARAWAVTLAAIVLSLRGYLLIVLHIF